MIKNPRKLKLLSIAFLVFPVIVLGKTRGISKEKRVTGSISTEGMKASEMPKFVKVTSSDAIKTAQRALPGRILSMNLEKEDGYLVYSIEMMRPNADLVEVVIDAGNRKILSLNKVGSLEHHDEDKN